MSSSDLIPTVNSLNTDNTTPTITGTVGIQPLPLDESFRVMVDGKEYNKASPYLTISGTTWSLQIPTSLTPKIYNVDAERNFRDATAKTVDTTNNELVISSSSTSPTQPMVNNPPTGNVIIDGFAGAGVTLTANSSSLYDADGINSSTMNYQWFLDSSPIANGQNYTVAATDTGRTLTVKASYIDNLGHNESVMSGNVTVQSSTTPTQPTSPVTQPVVNNPPTGNVIIEGFAQAGATLNANSSSLVDPEGINFSTMTYQWFVDNTPVFNGNNYTVSTTDSGRTLTVKASYIDNFGHNESVTSNNVIVQSQPTYTLFVDKPNVDEGQTVNVTVQNSSGFAQPNEVVNLIFGGNVSGTDLNTGYIPNSINIGADGKGQMSLNFLNDKIKEGTENLTLTLSNDPSKSIMINVNDPMNHPATGDLKIDGMPKIGENLSANSSSFSDQDGGVDFGSINYQWFADGNSMMNGKDYRVTNLDTGKNITVQATFKDGQGNDEVKMSNGMMIQQAATYNFFVDKPNVDEGQTVNLGIQTSNVAANTQIYFSFSGSAKFEDVAGNYIPNSFMIDASGTAQIPLTFQKDKMTEGTENLTFTLANDPSKSVTININDPMNNPPTGNVVINGDPKVGKMLSMQNNITDADGFSGSPNYQWLSDGVIISGKTQQNYTVVPEDANRNISVQVNYTDGLGNLEKMSSSPVFVSAEMPKPVEQPPLKPTYSLTVDKFNANEGDTITLGLQTTNVPAGTEVKFNFGGSISSTDTSAGLNFPSFFVGADGKAKLAVTFNNDKLTEGLENLTATLQNDPSKSVSINVNDTSIQPVEPKPVETKPVNSPAEGEVSISGDAQVGNVLTVENTLRDANGLGEITYQWLKNGKAISGATETTYKLTDSDLGKVISVTASYVDGQKNAESVTSEATDLVAELETTYNLTVDKTTVNEGSTVTFNLATTNLSKNDVVNFKFDGKISDEDVTGGLPDSQFVLDANGKASLSLAFVNDKKTEDNEKLTVTLVDDATQTASITVNDTSVGKAENHTPTGNVKIQITAKDGVPKVGASLSVANTLEDEDGLGDFNYQWLRAGKVIDGATDETYTLAKMDDGKKISVNVSYTDDLKFSESKTSAEITVANGLIKLGTSGKDSLLGGAKNDYLSGQANADIMSGAAGDDFLDGGVGNDSLNGGNGNDTLLSGDGNDTLVAGSGNDALDGGKGNDKLMGEKGNDTLQGGVGADAMIGGTGDDYYFVDNIKDVVTEAKSQGNDSVESTSTYTLGKNVENLILTGIADNAGTGNELNNQITGNIGDNKLNGAAGNDKLIGGAGADELDGGLGVDTLIGGDDDDTYYMNNNSDKIIEEVGGGKDEIIASVDFELSSSNIETLTLSGAKAINGTGDEFDNLVQEIEEGTVANTLDGKAGNDTINGQGGDDTIEGGEGNDIIDGGDGNDTAIFNGARNDYSVTPNDDVAGGFIVSYIGHDADINEGDDILTNVEILQFSDGEGYNIEDLISLTGVV